MDLGVGYFVFSSGSVSARPLLKRENIQSRKVTPWQRIKMSMRHSVPLFALGLIRLCSVKGLAYVEHVTEYGMHWNFFFTISLLPPIVELFDALVMVVPYEILSLGIAILYQVILESTNLKTFILLSLRGPDFLFKNREGIFSFFGHLAIFLVGRAIGTRTTLCLI
jgi:phosphatidylinositol glycan class W